MQPTNSHEHTHHHSPVKRSFIRKFLLRLVYSNAYLALPISAITLESYMVVSNFDFDPTYVIFLFFATLFLYPFHRLYGIWTTMPYAYTKQQKEAKKNIWYLYVSVAIGIIGSIYSVFQMSMELIQWMIPLAALSIGYSLPIIPTSSGWKRLRDIPGIKIYLITLVVTLTTSTVPLLLTGNIPHLNIGLLGLERFLFILAITIPFDIRDAHLDKKWNLKTIPLIIGKEKALNLAIQLTYVATAVGIIHVLLSDILVWEIIPALILSQIFVVYVLKGFTQFGGYLYNAFLVEGSMIYHAALITVAVTIHSLL